jgi:hypothetical protein
MAAEENNEASESPVDQPFRFVDLIVPRVDHSSRQIGPAGTVLLIVPLLLLALACCPPIRELVYTRLISAQNRNWLHTNKLSITQWTEFIRILAEVLLAVFVGGQVFNDSLRGYAREFLAVLQELINESHKKHATALRGELQEKASDLKEWLYSEIRIIDIPKSLLQGYRKANALNKLLTGRSLYLHYSLLSLRLYQMLPGGLYGALAYECFLTILLMKCTKYYLDFGT